MAATLGSVLAVAGTAWLLRSADAAHEKTLLQRVATGLLFADSLEGALATDASGGTRGEGAAVAGLYLERLRMGMGSPFRIIDQALRDPDLAGIGQRNLAEALLARTLHGEGYQVPPEALDLIENDPLGEGRGRGQLHLALIDSVVRDASSPRVGELTVRLAYQLATASGALSGRAPELATTAAAQVRDRLLAVSDARNLLEAAGETEVGRFTLMRMWREARRFAVERPVIVPLSAREERDAIVRLPQLVARLEAIAAGYAEADSSVLAWRQRPPVMRYRGQLPERLAAQARRRAMPPETPIVMAVSAYAPLINAFAAVPPRDRHRFVSGSVNEETIVAEYARLRAGSSDALPAAASAVLTAGVALRPYAQERIWMEGDPAPTPRDVQTRLGISVTFDSTVRPVWRPAMLRNLEAAIGDLQRILPSFDSRGLKVHFGASPLGSRALAMHDPIGRTIYFPLETSSGVMSHEFAHDLDWQAARREYGSAGWYRSDHAVRTSSGALAGALRQMASAARSASRRPEGNDRPTEVLARNLDWFISAALAREGRLNGYLSAVQDPVLTGYASAVTPEAAGDGGNATLAALAGLTRIPAPVRTWFADQFGAARRLTVHDALRQVLEAPSPRLDPRVQSAGVGRPFAALAGEFVGPPEVGSAWSCLLDGFTQRGTDAAAVRAVMMWSAEARAQGLIRKWGEFAARNPGQGSTRLRALSGAPWDPAIAEAELQRARDAILWSALTGKKPDLRDPYSAGSTRLRAAWAC